MIVFFRVLYALSLVWAIYVAFTEGIAVGVLSLLAWWAMLWVLMVVVDAIRGLGRLLTRPSQHLHVYTERHPDPTRPDDEHPIIVLNKNEYRRRT